MLNKQIILGLPFIYEQYRNLGGDNENMSDPRVLGQIKVTQEMVQGLYAGQEGVDIHSVRVVKMSKYVVTLSVFMSQNGGEPYNRTYNVGYPGVRCLVEVNGRFVLLDEVRPDGAYWSFPGGAFDDFFESYGTSGFEKSKKGAVISELHEETGVLFDADRLVSLGEFNPYPPYMCSVVYGFVLQISEGEFDMMHTDHLDDEIIESVGRFCPEDLVNMNLCSESWVLLGLYNLRNRF